MRPDIVRGGGNPDDYGRSQGGGFLAGLERFAKERARTGRVKIAARSGACGRFIRYRPDRTAAARAFPAFGRVF